MKQQLPRGANIGQPNEINVICIKETLVVYKVMEIQETKDKKKLKTKRNESGRKQKKITIINHKDYEMKL